MHFAKIWIQPSRPPQYIFELFWRILVNCGILSRFHNYLRRFYTFFETLYGVETGFDGTKMKKKKKPSSSLLTKLHQLVSSFA